MKAACEGHSRVVDELLIHAADVNSKNNVSNRLRNVECTSTLCTYMKFFKNTHHTRIHVHVHAHIFLYVVLDSKNG